MTRPKVSILIPAYEQEDYALQAVQSALAQDYPNLEVVFVDDASPVARYRAVAAIRDPRLRVVRNARNLGRTGNYRHALYELVTGDWVLVLDGDDYLTDPAFVRMAVEAGACDPDVVIVAGRAVTATAREQVVSPSPRCSAMDGLELLARLPRRDLLFMHMATLYRRQAALETDFYRVPYLSSDWESLYRLAARGRVAFIPAVAGVWRIHGVNASGSSDAIELGRNLAIWRSIYAAAVEAGMPARVARRASRRCASHIMRGNLPALFRAPGRSAFAAYLREAARVDRAALLCAVLSPVGAGRIVAGQLGYYRR